MIKAIETVYNGYRFRSRLEARWAVFFDTLKIPYEYEKEGYDLGDAGRYLPDYWLPQQDCWIEIKPMQPASNDVAAKKATALSVVTNKPIYIFCTFDDVPAYPGNIISMGISYTPDELMIWPAIFRECPNCHEITVKQIHFRCVNDNAILNQYSPRLHQAYIAARQARFEHIQR